MHPDYAHDMASGYCDQLEKEREAHNDEVHRNKVTGWVVVGALTAVLLIVAAASSPSCDPSTQICN